MAEERTELEELVHYLASSIVSDPEDVEVEERQENQRNIVQVKVADHDIGRVIGKGGRTIRSLRSVMALAEQTLGKTASIDLDE